MLNINFIQPVSSIYGPGDRYVIWTQGCSIHCKGCWNKDTWSFKEKQLVSAEDLIKDILIYKKEIEGVTILGGEPFDQYEEVLRLVKLIQENKLSVMLYTGYEREELQEKKYTKILEYIDILIEGRYFQKERNLFLQWRGSDNQRVLFLSDKYKDYKLEEGNYVEIILDESGKQTLFGYPETWISASMKKENTDCQMETSKTKPKKLETTGEEWQNDS